MRRQVCDFLLVVALHNEIGEGPDPEDIDSPYDRRTHLARPV